MLVHEAYRVELDFSPEQEVLFRKHCGMTRYVFNWALAKWIAWWEANKDLPKEARSKRPSAYDLSREFTATKPEWTEELIANVRTYALAAAEDAYKNFFRRLVEKTKAGKGYGFPRFKKKGKSRDAFTLQDQAFRAQPRAIKLAKIGMVKTKQYVAPTPDEKGAECLRSGKHRYLEGRVLRIVVSRWADSWYASIMVERNRPDPLPVRGPVVGVDFGTNHRITTSDGFQDAPGRDLERKLKRLEHLQHLFQHKIDPKKPRAGEKNRERLRMKIARLHKEVAQARADTIHKLTHRLATTCSTIIVEGFQIDRLVEKRRRKIKGWRRREARRRIYEASWGELRRQLEYKTKWYGSTLVVTEPYEATDRECHACGFVNEPPRHPTNEFRCTSCGTRTTRQLNTALRQYQVGT